MEKTVSTGQVVYFRASFIYRIYRLNKMHNEEKDEAL